MKTFVELPPIIQPRSCSQCTSLCCTLLGVKELDKPADKRCEHVQCGTGCTIYSERPKSCRDFECLWVQGMAPVELRPDLVDAVLWSTTDGKRIIVVVSKDASRGFLEEGRSWSMDLWTWETWS